MARRFYLLCKIKIKNEFADNLRPIKLTYFENFTKNVFHT